MAQRGFRLPKLRIIWEEDASASSSVAASEIQSGSVGDVVAALNEADRQERAQSYDGLPPKTKKRGLISRLLGIGRPLPPKRPIFIRLFSLKFGQFFNLLVWCVLAGLIIQITNFNPFRPQFDAATTAGNVGEQLVKASVWAVQNGWRPALTGAGIILPIWISWRIITLPFRR